MKVSFKVTVTVTGFIDREIDVDPDTYIDQLEAENFNTNDMTEITDHDSVVDDWEIIG